MAAAISFGLSPVWWSQATIAEVYALHALWLVGLLSLAIGVNHTLPSSADGGEASTQTFDRRMTALWFVVGLGLAHHRTALLVLPGLLLYLLWSVPGLWRPRGIWFVWAAALLAPLLLYLFIPLRASMGVVDLNGSYEATVRGFFNHVLASSYTGFLESNPLAVARTPTDWLWIGVRQFGLLGFGLGVMGLVWLVDRQRRLAKAWVFILVVLLTNLLFALNYRVADVEVFLLPVFLCGSIFIGGGVGFVARLANRWPAVARLLQAALLLLLVGGASGRAPLLNRSQLWAKHDLAVSIAEMTFPPQSHLVALEGEVTAIRYLQQAEGMAPELTTLAVNDPAQRRQVVASLLEQGKAVYLTREVQGIQSDYSFSGEGPLVRVWPRGDTGPSQNPEHPLDLSLAEDALRLEGYDLAWEERRAGRALKLTLYWRPLQLLESSYKVSLRMLDGVGNPIRRANRERVVEDRYPLIKVAEMPDWAPGAQVRDVQVVEGVPRSVSPALLQVIVYDAATGEVAATVDIDVADP
ncbi:MAG: DUF2723 domain-containing protein [Caldilineaceae bacterium]|nr:DUF2723 domain-containing protein [Caldilineaceae bacterium]